MRKLLKKICNKADAVLLRCKAKVEDCRGDLATNTIGAIIVAVVIVGLLVAAVRTFFPDFFADMFARMEEKLSSNW